MPVPAYAGANVSIGNAVTTVFPYNFKILDSSHIVVKVDGVVKTLGADYTVSGVGLSAGGNVTMNVAPANGAVVQRSRAVPYTRTTDYQPNGDLKEDTLDTDLDLEEMQVQQLALDIARAFKAPLSVTADQVLTDAQWAARALMLLGFDAGGNFGVFSTTNTLVSAFMATVLDDASAAAAFDTLVANGTATALLAKLTTEKVAFSGVLTPAQIAANQNDYNPANLATAAVLRLSSDARRNVTGLAGGSAGRHLTVHNVGTFPIVFTYSDALSVAANRFAFAMTLGGGQSMQIEYDATSSLWRAKALPETLGTLKEFAGGTVPAGFLACDGTAVSRATYAALFNEIGTTWGVGDGATTFNVPDFRRRAAVGSGGAGTGTLGNAVGNTGGEETHTMTAGELVAHSHAINSATSGGTGAAANTATNATGTNASITTTTVGTTTPFNVMQPSAVVTKIVKYA